MRFESECISAAAFPALPARTLRKTGLALSLPGLIIIAFAREFALDRLEAHRRPRVICMRRLIGETLITVLITKEER